MSRPAPWFTPAETPEGYHFEVVPDQDWRLGAYGTCRRPNCGRPGVAQLRRPTRLPRRPGDIFEVSRRRTVDRWWSYCENHLYGRWIEGDEVVTWRLAPDSGQ